MNSRWIFQATTLLMSLTATALLHFAVVDPSGCWPALGHLLTVLAVGVALFAGSMKRRRADAIHPAAAWALVSLALLPFLLEPVTRSTFAVGNPWESLLALALRNAMLGLAALTYSRRAQRLAGLISLFLVLFSFMWTVSPTAIALLIVYALSAMSWLLSDYWTGLAIHAAKTSRRELPIAPTAILAGCSLLVAALLPLAQTRGMTTAIAGFFPSSGGTEAPDPFARSGVGDGDQLVAATENASSFGPIESELYLESDMPSLYDVFNDMYDEPAECKRHAQVRAIPLSPSTVKPSDHRTATTKQAGREFSLVRQPAASRPRVADRPTHALFTVAGRVPLHVKLATFDQWDGHLLTSSLSDEDVAPAMNEADGNGQHWASTGVSYSPVEFPAAERHILRILNLRTRRVPAPPQLARVRVDQMQDGRLFRCTPDGGMAYAGEFLPQLTVMHVESRPANRHALANMALQRTAKVQGVSPRIAALAASWTANIPPGGRQVAAICERLQKDYQLDPALMAPEDCTDAAEHFLLESRRGPDYLFAASAALLLRSLGYEARVASGFYASPDKFDRSSGQTEVDSNDAHFWAEVMLLDGEWLAIEPTPGYRLLHSRLSWRDWLVGAGRDAYSSVVSHPRIALFATCSLCVSWRLRRPASNWLSLLLWKWQTRRGDARQVALQTLSLIETFARRSGAARPPFVTPRAWWAVRLEPFSPQQGSLAVFLDAVQWAMYGEGAVYRESEAVVRSSCDQVVHVVCAKQRRENRA